MQKINENIKNNFILNLGKSIISTSDEIAEQIKKAETDTKTKLVSNLTKKLEILKEIKKNKEENMIYTNHKEFFSKKNKFSCNNCNKSYCKACSQDFYGFNLLYTKGGEYFRLSRVIVDLLKTHIEILRNKFNRTSNLGIFVDKSTKEKIDYLQFLQISKIEAQNKKEFLYPSYITNLCFLEFVFSPVSLTLDKEIIHPNLRNIGNFFVGSDEFRHTEKNIVNIFKMFSSEVERILVILASQFSTKRSVAKTRSEWSSFIAKEISNMSNPGSSDIEKLIFETPHFIREESLKLRNSHPNSILKKHNLDFEYGAVDPGYKLQNPFFQTASDLQQIFADIALFGIILFKFVDLNKNLKSKLNVRPSQQEKEFINSFENSDQILEKLSKNVSSNLKYGNSVNLFSFAGVTVNHSYLSMNSLLNKFQSHFNLKNQFHFLELSELCYDYSGIEFIKFSLLQSKFSQSDFTNSDTIEFNVIFQDEGDETDVRFSISQKSFHEMEILSQKLNVTQENFELIFLRIQELLVFFDVKQFFFYSRDQRDISQHIKKLAKQNIRLKPEDSLVEYYETRNMDCDKMKDLSKNLTSIILEEIFRFVIFEAGMLSQCEAIREFNDKKCDQEEIFKAEKNNTTVSHYLHNITFQGKQEMSNQEFFEDSIFSFPKKHKDFSCDVLKNVIIENMASLEKATIETISKLNSKQNLIPKTLSKPAFTFGTPWKKPSKTQE